MAASTSSKPELPIRRATNRAEGDASASNSFRPKITTSWADATPTPYVDYSPAAFTPNLTPSPWSDARGCFPHFGVSLDRMAPFSCCPAMGLPLGAFPAAALGAGMHPMSVAQSQEPMSVSTDCEPPSKSPAGFPQTPTPYSGPVYDSFGRHELMCQESVPMEQPGDGGQGGQLDGGRDKGAFLYVDTEDAETSPEVPKIISLAGSWKRASPTKGKTPKAMPMQSIPQNAELVMSPDSLSQDPDDMPVPSTCPPGMPSRGSALHECGKCKPCAWFYKPGKCWSQQECGYCHLCPEGELKARKKAKVAAMRMGALLPANDGGMTAPRILKLSPLLKQ